MRDEQMKPQPTVKDRRMKTLRWFPMALALLLGAGASGWVHAAETPAAPVNRPTREELQKMTPEERKARLKQWQDAQKSLTAEQREAQRKAWRERLEKRVEDLKKKKAEGTITDQEKQQLDRLEQWLKRMDQSGAGAPATPAERPAGKPGDQPSDKPAAPPAKPK